MQVDEFMASLGRAEPPEGLSVALRGLWCCAKGDWDGAHHAVQDDPSPEAAWVHGHLHRVEGDSANARYWYTRARRQMPNTPIEVERSLMARVLLGQDTDSGS